MGPPPPPPRACWPWLLRSSDDGVSVAGTTEVESGSTRDAPPSDSAMIDLPNLLLLYYYYCCCFSYLPFGGRCSADFAGGVMLERGVVRISVPVLP